MSPPAPRSAEPPLDRPAPVRPGEELDLDRLAAHLAEHLPGAIAFPLDDIDGHAARLLPDKAAAIAVYCSNSVCNNSHVVAARLTELGYTAVFRYTEGKQDWIEAGLPIESAAPVA